MASPELERRARQLGFKNAEEAAAFYRNREVRTGPSPKAKPAKPMRSDAPTPQNGSGGKQGGKGFSTIGGMLDSVTAALRGNRK